MKSLELAFKFDWHGLGDVCQAAHLIQLYRRLGYRVKVQCEPNKEFVWKVAGCETQFEGDFPDHPWNYPSQFDDLSYPDCIANKTAFNVGRPPLPGLDGNRDYLWDQLCDVRLSATEFISDRARREAEKFIDGLPRPIICLHASGTNWRERKSLPVDLSFGLIVRLLESTPGSVVSLDWDSRDPVVASHRCRSILTNWGKIDPERLCALFELSDLLIGIDSGPLHLASLTKIPVIGVFTDLHPTQCCLPNPNAIYVAPDKYAAELEQPERADRWRFALYPGEKPDPEFIAMLAAEELHERGFKQFPLDLTKKHSLSPGTPYHLDFIGDCEWSIRLHDDGSLSGCDLVDKWEINKINSQISLLCGGRQVACLSKQGDECYRGRAAINDSLLQVEMIAADRQPFRSFGPVEPVKFRKHDYRYTTVEQFKNDCVAFARQLPPVRAVAGVPRSGMLAASLIALELNCPMIPLESLIDGGIPDIPVPRRGRGLRGKTNGIVLVVDDSCSSGRTLKQIRPKLHPNVKLAAIDGNMTADFYFREIDREVHQSYEWTLFHDENAEFTLSDMDGVLCEDWCGDDENSDAYLEFLNNAKPNRIPSYPLLAVVTNRLDKHRLATERWLEKHGVRYQHLLMVPCMEDRESHKPEMYKAFPHARLFVESCGIQSQQIFNATLRPVLSFVENRLLVK